MLEAKNITIRFGGIVAIKNASIKIQSGRITALIGPNGAGKTTMFNCISGVYTPTEGEVIFNDKNIEGKRGFEICNLGIARTYQVINLSWKMTALENVLVGMHCRLKSSIWQCIFRTPFKRREEKAAREKAMELIDLVGLSGQENERASTLSYGEQRLLEIARALASDPQILLLDEPAAGMNSAEKKSLDRLLQAILKKGIAILVIEHDMKLIMNISDYIYVLDDGHLIAEGTPHEIQNNPAVIAAYLGGE